MPAAPRRPQSSQPPASVSGANRLESTRGSKHPGRGLMPGAADPSDDLPLSGLPPQVAAILSDLIREAAETCGDDLVSLVLFGSAADRTLGPTSDVNLLVIL